MQCLGIDLAWGERARTGLAALDPGGALVASTSVVTDDEIAAFVQRWTSPGPGEGLVAAVDAPLVVPNLTGRRPCEAQVSAAFGRFFAGAYPANRANPAFAPEPRGARLARRFGWSIDPGTAMTPSTTLALEVYPHPAMVSLFGLDRVIPYKLKAGRDLPGLRAAYARLLDHLETTCGDVLRLRQSPRWAQLRATAAGARRKSELDPDRGRGRRDPVCLPRLALGARPAVADRVGRPPGRLHRDAAPAGRGGRPGRHLIAAGPSSSRRATASTTAAALQASGAGPEGEPSDRTFSGKLPHAVTWACSQSSHRRATSGRPDSAAV